MPEHCWPCISQVLTICMSAHGCQQSCACFSAADRIFAFCFQRGEFVPRQLSASSQDSVTGDLQARMPYSRENLAVSDGRAGQVGSRLKHDSAARGQVSLSSGQSNSHAGHSVDEAGQAGRNLEESSNRAGHVGRQAGQGSQEAEEVSNRAGHVGRQAGQGSEEAEQLSSCTSTHTDQSSHGTGRSSSRAGQSLAPLQLRESIQGLLNPQIGASQARSWQGKTP